MTVHLVTFSDESMSRARELCLASFKRHAGSLLVAYSTPELLRDSDFYRKNKSLLDKSRGCGYWAWKPYIIDTVLNARHDDGANRIPDGHYVIYADAGIEFINNVSHIIDRMDQDIFLFGNNWEHAHWCKRDIVEAVWPSNEVRLADPKFPTWFRFGKQCQASVIFFRVSDYSRRLVKEWLDWCLSGARIGAAVSFGKDNPKHRDDRMTWSEFRYLIDDSPSVFPNHPEFRENRHDQAILTTLAYREGIKLHWWGARYNMDRPDGGFVYPKLPEYEGDDYEPFVHHHRRRNHEWSEAA